MFGAIALSAAEPAPIFRSKMWQTEDGMPRNSVTAICQSRDGFLWIGTVGGLARFDGVEFEIVPIEPAAERFASITALCADAAGGVWVGSGSHGLFHWDGRRWESWTNAALVNGTITCLSEGKDGTIWIGTRSGLLQLNRGRLAAFRGFAALEANFIRSIFKDFQGRMWISYSSGVACLAGNQVDTHYPAEEFPDPLIRTAILDRRGNLWVGTRNGLNRRGNRVTTFAKKEGLPDNIISALYEDRRGILWVGTYGGLARREGGTFLTETTRDGDAFDQVFCFHEDHEGNLWVGTKEGLFRFSPQYCQTFTRRHGLAHNNVITVLANRDGGVWAGTWGGGLNLIVNNQVTGHFNRARFTDMRNDLVLAMTERPTGGIWFGTDFGGGFYELAPHRADSWNCTRYDPVENPPITAIRAIAVDRQQRTWVGTTAGLYQFSNNSLQRSVPAPDHTNTPVRCFLQGKDGRFWIGTEQGLISWSENSTNLFTIEDGLSDNRILSLHQDDEALWIGTAQGGLNRFAQGTFTCFTTANGLFNNTILEILETTGFLWMSSYHGIFCVKKEELNKRRSGDSSPLRCLTFGQEDGMESPVCVGAAKPSGCQSSDGRLWFPTTKGLVAVNPDIPPNDEPPPVVIRRLLADRKLVNLDRFQQVQGDGKSPDPVRLPPGRGELEIHFSALSFQAPGKNRYRYKLEGVDSDWVQATSRRMATYNNLKPGPYTFRVIACNNHGVWNEKGAALTLIWEPHFWQTWQFNALLAGIAGMAVFGLDRFRVSRLRAMERLRLRIAADLHDEVGSNLGSVSMLARLLLKSRSLTAEEQKDVALIGHVTAETANAVKDIVWFTNPAYDSMQDMLMRMKDTAETMMTTMECSLESDIENSNTGLSLEFRKNSFLIFKESLANIIKHSQATRVEISVSERNHLWQLRIADNGVGFNANAPSKGNGLKNLHRRAEEIGGTMRVSSEPGKGTTVHLTVPLH